MKKLSLILILSILMCGMIALTACDYTTQLSTPVNLDFNEETNILTWDEVNNATCYKLTIDINEFEVNTNSYHASGLPSGTHAFTVKALSDNQKYTESNWSTPKEFSIPYVAAQLIRPDNLIVDNTKNLAWDAINNASGYKININGNEFDADTNSYQLTNLILGVYTIKVMAAADGENYIDSDWSVAIKYTNVPDKILLIDGGNQDGNPESSAMEALLSGYDLDIVDLSGIPETLDTLRTYSQVILMNVANDDMPSSFVQILDTFVSNYGGGLFTAGGDKAYNKDDMNPYGIPSLYQKMLPVNCTNYRPLAVLIIIDRSGSMGANGDLDLAKQAAEDCINYLAPQDYVAVMTFEPSYKQDIEFISVLEKEKAINAVKSITAGGGTRYNEAFIMAAKAFDMISNVDRKHIIIMSDGKPADPNDTYKQTIYNLYAQKNITTTAVVVGSYYHNIDTMAEIAGLCGGNFYYSEYSLAINIREFMRLEVTQDSFRRVYYAEPFSVIINDITPAVQGINEYDLPQLGGFYNTQAKSNPSVVVPLIGNLAPIYAEWTYGKGKVGSFMSTLNGDDWSKNFMESSAGINFIKNVIDGLFLKT